MRWRRSVRWRPSDLDWRVAVLFMVGSVLFAVGSFPAYAQLVDPGVVGVTFVVGSLFFTAAASSQFLQVVDASDAHVRAGRVRLWAWQPGRTLWWSAVVQLIGTVLFNINTVAAMFDNLTVEETNRLVWAPDVFGSIAFLVASHLAWVDVCGNRWCTRRDDPDWWTAALNYLGSVFFMMAAVAAFTLPTTGQTLNLTLVNSATFLGAVCFLVGAYLLLPPADVPHRLIRSG